jgi:hypothetical protein
MYSASVPVFRQMLGSLAAILEKAEAHADLKKIEPDALLQARLFPDMFPLLRQVQVATDFAKGTVARLGGVEVPRYEDNETDFAGLQARIAKTLAFIDSVPREAIEAGATRDITIGSGRQAAPVQRRPDLSAALLAAALLLPRDDGVRILRHNGVEIGKKDFIGSF